MVFIGEKQVRSSPKWPPPPRHELGGWTIEEPPTLKWIGAINLPATIPIEWLSHNNGFEYALENHSLVVYVPWTLFVFLLWYFIGYRLDKACTQKKSQSPGWVYSVQGIVTFELLYYAWALATTGELWRFESLYVTGFWVWLVVLIIGWLGSLSHSRVPERTEKRGAGPAHNL